MDLARGLFTNMVNVDPSMDKWLHQLLRVGWIIYPLPNFNCCAVEVWEWLSNFIAHFIGHVITYPCINITFSLWSTSRKGDFLVNFLISQPASYLDIANLAESLDHTFEVLCWYRDIAGFGSFLQRYDVMAWECSLHHLVRGIRW